MAGTFYGADVAQLRLLAASLRSAGRSLDGQRQLLGAGVDATRWPGPDAERFRGDWKTSHSRSLSAAALFLKLAAEELVRQATEQETASAGSGGLIVAGPRPGVQAPVPGPGDIKGKSAAEVRTWWLGLTASQQQTFIRNYPVEAGNTNGIPFSARIEANRANAQSRIDWLTKNDPAPVFDPLMLVYPGYPERYAAELRAWGVRQKDGVDYFRRVVAGDVQLAAYDPSQNSIVEMIGTYGPDTSAVITYVPGTLTNEASFYKGDAQHIARYLESNGLPKSTAAFVYKGTEFPDGGPEAFVVEARDDNFVAATSPVLKDFQAAVDLEKPAGARTVGVGHSWGARNLTGSEAAGAHYDKVIALSGAAIPPGWTPDARTQYVTFTSPDLLWTVELTGAVGANYPMKEPAFEKHLYAPSDGVDWSDPISMENHSLITSIGPENVALSDILKEISQ